MKGHDECTCCRLLIGHCLKIGVNFQRYWYQSQFIREQSFQKLASLIGLAHITNFCSKVSCNTMLTAKLDKDCLCEPALSLSCSATLSRLWCPYLQSIESVLYGVAITCHIRAHGEPLFDHTQPISELLQCVLIHLVAGDITFVLTDLLLKAHPQLVSSGDYIKYGLC